MNKTSINNNLKSILNRTFHKNKFYEFKLQFSMKKKEVWFFLSFFKYKSLLFIFLKNTILGKKLIYNQNYTTSGVLIFPSHLT